MQQAKVTAERPVWTFMESGRSIYHAPLLLQGNHNDCVGSIYRPVVAQIRKPMRPHIPLHEYSALSYVCYQYFDPDTNNFVRDNGDRLSQVDKTKKQITWNSHTNTSF